MISPWFDADQRVVSAASTIGSLRKDAGLLNRSLLRVKCEEIQMAASQPPTRRSDFDNIAHCCCGWPLVEVNGAPALAAACHCMECQPASCAPHRKRTGSKESSAGLRHQARDGCRAGRWRTPTAVPGWPPCECGHCRLHDLSCLMYACVRAGRSTRVQTLAIWVNLEA